MRVAVAGPPNGALGRRSYVYVAEVWAIPTVRTRPSEVKMDADGVGPRRAGSAVVVVVRRGVVPLVAEVLDAELKLQLVADLVAQRAIQACDASQGSPVVGRGVDPDAIDRAPPHPPLWTDVLSDRT